MLNRLRKEIVEKEGYIRKAFGKVLGSVLMICHHMKCGELDELPQPGTEAFDALPVGTEIEDEEKRGV